MNLLIQQEIKNCFFSVFFFNQKKKSAKRHFYSDILVQKRTSFLGKYLLIFAH